MKKTKKILFIGDSITEWGRFDDHDEKLGHGYVRIIHDYLTVTYPSANYEIINHGISGNRVTDLAQRWDEDVIKHNPDILSISIGINDVWRQLDQQNIEQVYPDQFKEIYNDLLLQVKEKTNATIVLMEPTVIEEDVQSKGNQLLIPYVETVNELAKKYGATIVNTHEVFLNYIQKGNYSLTIDGVHMNSAGNMLMAKSWLESVKEIL